MIKKNNVDKKNIITLNDINANSLIVKKGISAVKGVGCLPSTGKELFAVDGSAQTITAVIA